MPGKNQDHLAIYPYLNTSWVFVLNSDAETYSEVTSEMIDVCGSLFDSFGDIVNPNGVKYNVSYFQNEFDTKSDNSSGPVEATKKNVDLGAEPTFETFSDSFPQTDQYVQLIGIIEFDDNRVLVHLEEGDVWADKEHYCKDYRLEDDIKDDPATGPITINVEYGPLGSDLDAASCYVDVGVHSDIWFGDSAISETNQKYLSSFLERIHHNTSADEIRRESETYAESILERVYL